MGSRSTFRRTSRPAGGCGARCWRRARSSAYCPVGWARGIRCGWGRRGGATATRDQGVDFVGREALEAIEAAGGPQRKLVGLEVIERGIGRDGYPVCAVSGEKIGAITSGSPAPFLKKNIALAYVPVQYASLDEVVAVEIRGQLVKARVVPTPFYKRTKKTA